MHSQRRSAIAMLAALAALVLAATAWADTGSDPAPDRTSTTPGNGGTAAGRPPAVEDSGGVSSPARRGPQARPSQQPAQDEQPPQIEDPPEEEPAPDGEEETESPEETPAEPDDDAAAAPGTGAGSGGGGGGAGIAGLPSTGLEIGALVAMGLGLLLAGVVLRRRPST